MIELDARMTNASERRIRCGAIVADESPNYLFVTGRLAEFSLGRLLEEIAPKIGLRYQIAVLPISVAALMTPRWVAAKLTAPEDIDRIVLPGHCRGDLEPLASRTRASIELGPEDLLDLPAFLGATDQRKNDYGSYQIEIFAEINHAPRLSSPELLAEADRLIAQGADWIDLGCDPGGTWDLVGDAVKAVRDRGARASIDSWNPVEVELAVRAGAEVVFSVDGSNRERALDWGAEVVVVPDKIGSLDGLDESVNYLEKHNIAYRIDPILEPIGFGFAASLGRYLETRRRYPEARMLMGVGNLTELTDADSAGINTLLIGFCAELSIGSVLTTSVGVWARTSVKEIDLARRLADYAVRTRSLPKRIEPGLVMLRDPGRNRIGGENLAELAARIRDPNWRIFVEDHKIHVMNNKNYFTGDDPFELFDRMNVTDASHAFYLGYELMKAKTAATLDKSYRQDQALSWGFLTEAEPSRHARRGAVARTSVETGAVARTSLETGAVARTSVETGAVARTSVETGAVARTSVVPESVARTSFDLESVARTSFDLESVARTSVEPESVARTSFESESVEAANQLDDRPDLDRGEADRTPAEADSSKADAAGEGGR
jgi:dihydropteroate synthase